MDLRVSLPKDIWYQILSEIPLSKYPQIANVDCMLRKIYNEILSVQISESVFDDIFNEAFYIGCYSKYRFQYIDFDSKNPYNIYLRIPNIIRIMSGMGELAYSN